ncbi:hypothetical protein ILUMI_17273, partial [Ignelater luminosus]
FCRFVKTFQRAFSLMLMVIYVTFGSLICVELFTSTESHSFRAQVRHTISFVVFSCRLCFYCIPANYITNKALTVSDAVYSSKWYYHEFSRLKATVLLMIQNSQNGITIKACDLITINAATAVKVSARIKGSLVCKFYIERTKTELKWIQAVSALIWN